MEMSAAFESVHQRIQQACERVKRDPAEVTLLAVSKGHPPAAIAEAVELGQVIFGENKVQEAKFKTSQCPSAARWHMIGHLQTNKCRDALQIFEMVESVDSMRLAEGLNKAAERASRSLPILLEVNVSGESTKFGYGVEAVVEELEDLNALPKIEIHGLMTMAPWSRDPEKVRAVFRRLREVKMKCEDRLGVPMPHLSMGMSGDFEVAIEEGSTLVRLGTSLFGPRKWKPRSDTSL
jgi:pyridoxal phosphate enzyme (YggS family)